jgi:diguanylate cyclase (GGDEF)-like protein
MAISMEKLGELASRLLKADSFERSVSLFDQICKEEFGIFQLSLVKVNKLVPFSTERQSFLGRKTNDFDDVFLDLSLRRIKMIDVSKLEYREGLNALIIENRPISFGMLGDPIAEFYCIVLDYGLEPSKQQELDFLFRVFYPLCQLHLRYRRSQSLIYTDDLTGLYNARYLEEAIDNEVRRAERFGTHFSLLFVDLDNFKSINDKFGHLAGSSVLQQMRDVLKQGLRDIDSVIRYGGDEFVIILLGATSDKAFLAAERLRRAVEESRFMLDDGHHVSLTASIGVATFPDHAATKKELLKLADTSMYRSKKTGKNKVNLYKPDDKEDHEEQISKG